MIISSVRLLIKALFCKWFGHDMVFVREVKKGVVEKKCKRCGDMYGYGYGKRVKLTSEIRKLHDKIITEEYFNNER